MFRPARPTSSAAISDPKHERRPYWVQRQGGNQVHHYEYGLYEDRWWMLRYAALDAIGNMGSWLGIPVKFERVYTDY